MKVVQVAPVAKWWTDSVTGRVVYGTALRYTDSQNFRVYVVRLADGHNTLIRV